MASAIQVQEAFICVKLIQEVFFWQTALHYKILVDFRLAKRFGLTFCRCAPFLPVDDETHLGRLWSLLGQSTLFGYQYSKRVETPTYHFGDGGYQHLKRVRWSPKWAHSIDSHTGTELFIRWSLDSLYRSPFRVWSYLIDGHWIHFIAPRLGFRVT